MCNSLVVRWTIIPRIAPQPWIACSGCGGFRAFRSSGKIRLNANGRKLDAWLVYKCTGCGRTWNRTIFERQNVRDIDSATLEAMHSNDPDWIRAQTFNLEALKRRAQRIDEFAQVEIRKDLLREAPGWKHLVIELSILFPTSARLDRLLASELRLSRSQLSAFHQAGLLTTDPDRSDSLRRRVSNGVRVMVDLSRRDDRELVWKRLAIGENVTTA